MLHGVFYYSQRLTQFHEVNILSLVEVLIPRTTKYITSWVLLIFYWNIVKKTLYRNQRSINYISIKIIISLLPFAIYSRAILIKSSIFFAFYKSNEMLFLSFFYFNKLLQHTVRLSSFLNFISDRSQHESFTCNEKYSTLKMMIAI